MANFCSRLVLPCRLGLLAFGSVLVSCQAPEATHPRSAAPPAQPNIAPATPPVVRVEPAAVRYDTVERLVLAKQRYTLLWLLDARSDRKHLAVWAHDTLLHTIPFPTQLDQQGFSVNWLRPNARGFELSIEYGSSWYFNKVLYFVYREHRFWLDRIHVTWFDQHDPNHFFHRRTQLIRPRVTLAAFALDPYLTD